MDEFKQARREHDLMNDIMHARDLMTPIIDGQIKRGHCKAGERECYGGRPGMRKATLKDAVKIAKTAVFILNRAMAKYEKYEE